MELWQVNSSLYTATWGLTALCKNPARYPIRYAYSLAYGRVPNRRNSDREESKDTRDELSGTP